MASSSKWMRRLMVALVLVGVLSLVSFSLGAHIIWRFISPPLGAWWNLHEFWLMETDATIVGLLIGARSAGRISANGLERDRGTNLSPTATLAIVFVAAIALTPILSRVARLQWWEGSLGDGITGVAGFEVGSSLERLVSVFAYFLKTAAFGFLIGVAVFGALAAAMAFSRVETQDLVVDAKKT
jgi:hypothetical protein